MNNFNVVPILQYAMRHTDKPCPVKGFEFGLQDLTVDGIAQFALVISRKQFNADYYSETQRIQLATWLNDVLLPQLNQYAPVYLSVVGEGVNDHEGDADFGE